MSYKTLIYHIKLYDNYDFFEMSFILTEIGKTYIINIPPYVFIDTQ